MIDIKEKTKVTICTETPTYLQELLGKSQKMYLIFKEKLSSNSDETSIMEQSYEVTEDNISELELTGNPLETDLQIPNLSMSIQIFNLPKNWSKEETKYSPLTSENARSLVNEHFHKSNFKEHGDNLNLPVFGVCDGLDDEGTLIIGCDITAKKFSRIVVQSKGLFPLSHPSMQIDHMKNEHLEDVFGNNIVHSEINSVYSVYGYKIRKNTHCDDLEYPGSIQVELSWNALTYAIPKKGTKLNMTLQVAVGHPKSSAYNFWESMLLLKKYISFLDAFNDCEMKNIILSNDDNNVVDISNKILDILIDCQFKEENTDFKTNMPRVHNIFDKLYDLLSLCCNLNDLKTCFDILFNEIAQNPTLKLYIPENNCTTIRKIILNIYNGASTVPTLNQRQSLEFLIELGLEKLRQDYFYILHQQNCWTQQELEDYWNSHLCTDEMPNLSIRKSKVLIRRTTVSGLPMQKFISKEESTKKLSILSRMHIVVEFLFLFKERCKVSNENVYCLTENLFENWLSNPPEMSLSLEGPQVFDIHVSLPFDGLGADFFESKSMLSWKLKLSTKCNKSSSVETIYLHTSYPIFPPNIVNKYASSLEEEEAVYYSTKVTICTDIC